MNWLRYVVLGLLLMAGYTVRAQDPDLEGMLEETALDEAVVSDASTETLLLDNTRSKIGRDFYDSFFRHYAGLPKPGASFLPTDSTKTITPNVELDLDAFVVTVDELPAFGIGTTIISVTLNDQLIWQNYVQFRQEIIEAYANNAAEVVNQYVINYKDVQRQLESEDQRGSGIF